MINRIIKQKVINVLEDGMVAIIYGARQVGKTTLAKNIATSYKNPLYINCDDPLVAINIINKSALELKAYIGNSDLVIFDEAQRIENIGITLKLLHDTYPNIKLLVTGSSSLDLANKIAEPLTGRSIEIKLYPLSIQEVSEDQTQINPNINILLIRGGYPGMWELSSESAYNKLDNLALNYIFKDAFTPSVGFDQTIINDLLRLLAFQIGHEVNYSELGNKLSISKDTAARYIDLLEKAFIIFRRNQYRRNMRSEVGRLRKIYFVDLGIRNALINNFNALETRDDVGSLWENFCVIERLKYLQTTNRRVRSFYWRNNNQREIDIVEEENTAIRAYECKFSQNKKPTVPAEFAKQYPNSTYNIVNPQSFTKEILS